MNEIEKLKKALLKESHQDYEKVRSELIKKHGYSKFRDLQKEAFKKL